MKKLLTVMMFCFLSLTSLAFAGNQTPKKELSQRIVLVNSFVENLKVLFEKTKDETILRELSLLQDQGIVAVPGKDGAWPMRTPKGDDFIIVPLLPKDAQLSPWNEMLEQKEAAAYSGPSHLLTLNTGIKISPIFQGIILGHELLHRIIDPEGAALKNPMKDAEEEARVHSIENSWLLKVGGKAYQGLLDERMKEVRERSNNPNHENRPLSYYNEKMDTIFGPALSDDEKLIRAASMEIAVMFQMIDRYGDKTSALEQKTLSLLELYKGNGNIKIIR